MTKYRVIRVDEVLHHLCKIAARIKGKTMTKFLDKELNELFQLNRFKKVRYIYQQEMVEGEDPANGQ